MTKTNGTTLVMRGLYLPIFGLLRLKTISNCIARGGGSKNQRHKYSAEFGVRPEERKKVLKAPFVRWRRERDSNPRRLLHLTRFPSVRDRPLCHLSTRWWQPIQPYPKPDAAVTVAPFRAWRGSQHVAFRGPRWVTIGEQNAKGKGR